MAADQLIRCVNKRARREKRRAAWCTTFPSHTRTCLFAPFLGREPGGAAGAGCGVRCGACVQSCVWRHGVCAFACSLSTTVTAQVSIVPYTCTVVTILVPAEHRTCPCTLPHGGVGAGHCCPRGNRTCLSFAAVAITPPRGTQGLAGADVLCGPSSALSTTERIRVYI